MDEIEPANLGYRVMGEVAFEITKRQMRKKVDAFIQEHDLHPTGEERAQMYRINYYHMLFWMMAQLVAKPAVRPEAVPVPEPEPEPEKKVIFSFDMPAWAFKAYAITSEYEWVFKGIGIGCIAFLVIEMLCDFFGKH